MIKTISHFVILSTAALAGAVALPHDAHATIFHSKESALKLAFPKADVVERHHFFLTGEQLETLEAQLGKRPSSRLIDAYEGRRGGESLGFAFVDTHLVRTKPETFMVVIAPEGTVRAVHVLAFHEPREYLPSQGWLKQFRGTGGGDAAGGRERDRVVAGIAGATLSARAIKRGVGKVLALYNLLIAPSSRQVAAAGGGG